MTGIWSIGKPSLTVEKRKLKPRKRERKPKRIKASADPKPIGPTAKDAMNILRTGRFPADWWRA